MSLKNDICKKIVSVCLGKASLALALGFIILNPVSAYAACTVGNEIEINDWDGWAGEGFNPNAAEGGPCVVSQYRAPINRFGGGNWEACTDSGANPSSAKSPGPHAGTTQAGKCISRVWRNGSSNSNATQCKVFGYECSGGTPPTTPQGTCANGNLYGPDNPGGTADFVGCSDCDYVGTNGVLSYHSCDIAPCPSAPIPDTVSGLTNALRGQITADGKNPNDYNISIAQGTGYCPSPGCDNYFPNNLATAYACKKTVTRVDGLCSTTANQCTYGTFVDETDTATEFQWRCNGLNGGTNSDICRANKVIPGECGYASGGTYTSSPLAADSLCATGNPSGVTGDGTPTAPWSWSCTGINGGANANCSANLCLPPEDGVCNNTTRNSCASGDLSNAGENATHYTWQCNGRYGGANATNCSRVKNTTTGVCNRSVENGCTSGTLNNTVDSGTHFLWQCLGSEGGASENCDMPKPASINGVCSSSVNGCSAGDFVDAADDTVNYRWQCNGRNGGTNQPCSAAIPVSYTFAWEASGFGACSVSCGGGTQTQNVVCKRNDGQTVADGNCTGTKPATSQGCNTQACAPSCNTYARDIVYVIDGSDSIAVADFARAKTFLNDLTSGLSLTSNDQVGVVQYSTDLRIEKGLNNTNPTSAINSMVQLHQSTNTYGGLIKAGDMLAPTNSNGHAKTVVLITDGLSWIGHAPSAADTLKAGGYRVIAIGVGPDVNSAELNGITANQSGTNLYSVSDYSSLNSIIASLSMSICSTVPPNYTYQACSVSNNRAFTAGGGCGGVNNQEAFPYHYYDNCGNHTGEETLDDCRGNS